MNIKSILPNPVLSLYSAVKGEPSDIYFRLFQGALLGATYQAAIRLGYIGVTLPGAACWLSLIFPQTSFNGVSLYLMYAGFKDRSNMTKVALAVVAYVALTPKFQEWLKNTTYTKIEKDVWVKKTLYRPIYALMTSVAIFSPIGIVTDAILKCGVRTLSEAACVLDLVLPEKKRPFVQWHLLSAAALALGQAVWTKDKADVMSKVALAGFAYLTRSEPYVGAEGRIQNWLSDLTKHKNKKRINDEI